MSIETFIERTDQKCLIDSLPPTPLFRSIRQGYVNAFVVAAVVVVVLFLWLFGLLFI